MEGTIIKKSRISLFGTDWCDDGGMSDHGWDYLKGKEPNQQEARQIWYESVWCWEW